VLAYGAVFESADDADQRENEQPEQDEYEETPRTTGTRATAENRDTTAARALGVPHWNLRLSRWGRCTNI
jgi:hypothetical protein